jgi:hypothetical protein
MKPKLPSKSKALQPAKPGFDGLPRELREFITESRRHVLCAVDVAQVRTCLGVGRHIVEFEQGGAGGVRGEVAALLGGEADGGFWEGVRRAEACDTANTTLNFADV